MGYKELIESIVGNLLETSATRTVKGRPGLFGIGGTDDRVEVDPDWLYDGAAIASDVDSMSPDDRHENQVDTAVTVQNALHGIEKVPGHAEHEKILRKPAGSRFVDPSSSTAGTMRHIDDMVNADAKKAMEGLRDTAQAGTRRLMALERAKITQAAEEARAKGLDLSTTRYGKTSRTISQMMDTFDVGKPEVTADTLKQATFSIDADQTQPSTGYPAVTTKVYGKSTLPQHTRYVHPTQIQDYVKNIADQLGTQDPTVAVTRTIPAEAAAQIAAAHKATSKTKK